MHLQEEKEYSSKILVININRTVWRSEINWPPMFSTEIQHNNGYVLECECAKENDLGGMANGKISTKPQHTKTIIYN